MTSNDPTPYVIHEYQSTGSSTGVKYMFSQFVNIDPSVTDCTFSCSNTCVETKPYALLSSTQPYELAASNIEVFGYETTICLKCVPNIQYNEVYPDTHLLLDIKVFQNMPICKTGLSLVPNPSITIDYDYIQTSQDYNLETFFVDNGIPGCLWTCKLGNECW